MEGLFILWIDLSVVWKPATVRSLLPMEASGFTSSLECPWFGGFKVFLKVFF